MKKYFLLIFSVCLLVVLMFSGCNNLVESPIVYVSLRHSDDKNIQKLDWIVENRSENISINFPKGNILNYEIINTTSGEKYESSKEDNTDITLKPNETYTTTIEFTDMSTGHYEASFWANWSDNKKSAMTIYFDAN